MPIKLADLPPFARTDKETAQRVWRSAEIEAAARDDARIVQEYRLRSAYRMVRELARTLNLITFDSALSSLSARTWIEHQSIPTRTPHGSLPMQALAVFYDRVDNPHLHGLGPVPDPQLIGMPLVPTPKLLLDDHLIADFSKIYTHIAQYLRFDRQDYTTLGFNGLTSNPPVGWPTPDRLYAYEGMLVDEVLTVLIEKGQRAAEKTLTDDHGMMPHEVRGMVRLAKAEARDRTEADVEEDRALIALRVEDVAARAREALDLRTELSALKTLTIVKGITKTEPDDAIAAFANAVNKVATESRPSIAPPIPVEALPPSSKE